MSRWSSVEQHSYDEKYADRMRKYVEVAIAMSFSGMAA